MEASPVGRVRQLGVLMALSFIAAAQTISTVAGDGTSFTGGIRGDGGPATRAQLERPIGVAVDRAGNLYIASATTIRKVNAAGIITTVAGTGYSAGGCPDGVSATSAAISGSGRVAVDRAGNLYLPVQQCVCRVSPNGIITTVAGDNGFGYSGDGGPAVHARFRSPMGVAVDAAGNLYIADSGNDCIRKVGPDGIITTVLYREQGGSGTNTFFANPTDVAVDASGALYVSENRIISREIGSRVYRVSPEGIRTAVTGGWAASGADGGPAVNAWLNVPFGLAADAAGNLYIAETGPSRVRSVVSGGIITTVAGNGTRGYSGDGGPAALAQLNTPQGVAVDSAGTVYIADSANNRVRAVYRGAVGTATAVNGASFAASPLPLAPGSIASFFGSGFDTHLSLFAGADFVPGSSPPVLPANVSGVSVKVGGLQAALFFVGVGQASGLAPGSFQINCQVPMEAAAGALPLEVFYGNTLIARGAVSIGPAGPGVFTLTQSGQGQAVVVNQDGSLNGDPANPVIPGTNPRPAERGSFIVVYGTGPGAQLKNFRTGQPLTLGTGQAAACAGEPLYATAQNPVVTVGAVPAEVSFSGMAPCFVGLWQINARVPQDAPVGATIPLSVTMGASMSNATTIVVR